MTQENKTEKPARVKRDLVAISEAAAQKLDRYIEQINAQKPINISRKVFLSWFLESGPENLSNKQVSAAIERFYKTKTHLRQLLREVAIAEANGQEGEFEIIFRPKRTDIKKELITEDTVDSL